MKAIKIIIVFIILFTTVGANSQNNKTIENKKIELTISKGEKKLYKTYSNFEEIQEEPLELVSSITEENPSLKNKIKSVPNDSLGKHKSKSLVDSSPIKNLNTTNISHFNDKQLTDDRKEKERLKKLEKSSISFDENDSFILEDKKQIDSLKPKYFEKAQYAYLLQDNSLFHHPEYRFSHTL